MNTAQATTEHAPLFAENSVACTACDFKAWAGNATRAFYESTFKAHSSQYMPGRAPDITIDYVISASCSVCEDGGNIDANDSDSVSCEGCGTTWSIDGTWGERSE